MKTLALRTEQMTRKAYVIIAPDMRNAQMNDALVKTIDPQQARTALKTIANHRSNALEPQLPFAKLVKRINNISLDIDNLTVNEIHMMEQDIAQGINVVRHKYSNDPKFKRKPLFLKFCKKCSQSGHSFSTCPDKRYANPREKLFENKLSTKR